jgi:hypothetical protein
MIGVFVGFSRIFLLGILIFKGLTARRLYKAFGVKGLTKFGKCYHPHADGQGNEQCCVRTSKCSERIDELLHERKWRYCQGKISDATKHQNALCESPYRAFSSRSGELCCSWRVEIYVVCLKSSVNGTRKQTKQKIQTNQLYWPSK